MNEKPKIEIESGRKCKSCFVRAVGVIDSRETRLGGKRRRLRCNNCGERTTTYEIEANELAELRERAGALDDMRRVLGLT